MIVKKTLLLSLIIAAGVALPSIAQAFCGFYVAGADTKLYNNATMVTLMRDGKTTVLSMANNYQGPTEDFAMVVPVPVVLQKKDVKTLSHDIFSRLDKLAAPRLVEYWEQDPCPVPGDSIGLGNYGTIGRGSGTGYGSGSGRGGNRTSSVVVEAQFEVGEYEIVILSAKDALGLETWIASNGYKIPAGAAPFLEPYVAQGSKFFVAKVNPKKVTFKDGMAQLSPLRFHYTEEDFRLPIRLGLINAKDKQDLIVHILAKNQRYEVANYKNVTIPTNLIVSDSVRSRFGEFYAALFDATTEKNPGAVVTEYSWNANTCDPCPEPALKLDELLSLGLDVVGDSPTLTRSVSSRSSSSTQAQVRLGAGTVGEGLHKSIVRRYFRRRLPRLRYCYEKALIANSSLSGTVTLNLTIKPDGSTTQVSARGLGDKAVESCMAKTAEALMFPKPLKGASVKVGYPLSLSSQAPSPGRSSGLPAPSGWVLTRLHARYDRSSLGEDLVFKEAKAVAGGQGGASDQLMKTAKDAGTNTFQGRYIIRHEWEGAMECKAPQRGRWGRPPAGVSRDTMAKVATNLAFAPRGSINLASMVTDPLADLGLVSGTGLSPAVATPPEATPPAEPGPAQEPPPVAPPAPAKEDKAKSKGCGVGGGSSPASALLLCLGLFLARRRATLVRND